MIMMPRLLGLLLLLSSFPHGTDGQEYQAFNTPIYEEGAFHRSNYCPLHYQMEIGNLTLKEVLQNQQVSVGLFQNQLEEYPEGSGKYRIPEENPSAGIQFLDELALRGGFTWRDSYGILLSPNSELNQTWSGVLRWGVDTYDVVGDWYLQTLERMAEGIAFPEGWYDGSLIMVRKKPDPSDYGYNLWACFSPFTDSVWYTLIGTTIFSGLVYCLLDYMNAKSLSDKMELSLMESMYATSIIFTGHLIHLPPNAASQILVFSVCLLALLVISAYTANLASYLVIRNTPSIVINDIKDALMNDLCFCVLVSSTSDKTLEGYGKTYPVRIKRLPSIAETYHGVVNGDCDIVLTTVGTWKKNKLNAEYNPGCDTLEYVGRVVKPLVAGYSIRDSAELCSSMLRDALSLLMIEMKLDNKYALIWDGVYRQSSAATCDKGADGSGVSATSSEDEMESNKLGLYNMGGIFILHLGITTFAILGAAIQLFRRQRARKINQRQLLGSSLACNDFVPAKDKERGATVPTEDGNTQRGDESLKLEKSESNRKIAMAAPAQRYVGAMETDESKNPAEAARKVDPKMEWLLIVIMTVATGLLWASFFMLRSL